MLVLPILDRKINDRIPVATYLLISANVFVFCLYMFTGIKGITETFETYGVIATKLSVLTLFSHMFLHAGGAHLGANMFFLWFFGRNVERKLGSIPFVIFYFISGICAALLFVVFNPTLEKPLVGASGAVCGLLGMYFVLFPKREIELFYWVIVWGGTFRIPAYIFLVLYFIIELLQGLFTPSEIAEVANLAHAGGFAGGVILVFLLTRAGYRLAREVYQPFQEEKVLEEKMESLLETPSAVAKLLNNSQSEPEEQRKVTLVARDFIENTEVIKSIKQQTGIQSRYDLIIENMLQEEADSLKTLLAGSGYKYAIIPERPEEPSLEIVLDINFAGYEMEIRTPDATHFAYIRQILYLTSGLIDDSVIIDIVVMEESPVIFRVTDKNFAKLKDKNSSVLFAKNLVKNLPGVRLTSSFVALSRGEFDAIRKFGRLEKLDEYNYWSVVRLMSHSKFL
jgi:membrane associated rhomboid family serine protease